MLVFSDQIVRLDASVKLLEICDADWAINPDDHMMQHLPTRTVFEIEIDKKVEGELLAPTDFSARLTALGTPCALPPRDAIERLGREALLLYLVAFGYMWQKEQPELAVMERVIRNAPAC